jgi:hypothetical protein
MSNAPATAMLTPNFFQLDFILLILVSNYDLLDLLDLIDRDHRFNLFVCLVNALTLNV